MALSPSFTPTHARFFELINDTLELTPEEIALLKRNGFVVSDRLSFADFATAYAYLHRQDLPVLITTDSILHSIHQTYDDLLTRLEETMLFSRLTSLLSKCREQVQVNAKTNSDPLLAPLFADLEIYLTVPLALLSRKEVPITRWAPPGPDISETYDTPGYESYVEQALAASGIAPITLFGTPRLIDFTLFKPRGHYTRDVSLQRYFRAMSWLAQIDFRLVAYDEYGTPQLNIGQVAAAALLSKTIEQAGERSTWNELDTLLSALIGRSDNMTLSDLERFLADAGKLTPDQIVHHSAPDQLLHLLTVGDYGHQRIAGQIQFVSDTLTETVPRHVSFMLLGQRFAIDSSIMSKLVYDQLIVNGQKVERFMPSPLDVMYVLGNDRAETHLQVELSKYGYKDNLQALRQAVEREKPTFWTGSIYHRLLDVLRKLNIDTTNDAYPAAMRSAAWADKTLHTQLAFWAQLRHDNILYVKQSFSVRLVCEYPAGYVEPYPACYAAMKDYAEMGQQLFAGLNAKRLTQAEQYIRQVSIDYFTHLHAVTSRLQTLAEKELRQKPFNREEEEWLKQTAVRSLEQCGSGGAEEKWTGWYPQLFPWGTMHESPALIADVHTNPSPPAVLHVATGPVASMFFIVNTDKRPTMYIGPAFTYYEVLTTGAAPERLTDEEWRKQLATNSYPAAPEWTGSFRCPPGVKPQQLVLAKTERDSFR